MGRYRKKPLEVDAWQIGMYERTPDWVHKAVTMIYPAGNRAVEVVVSTPEGEMRALSGDWLIRGIEGEVYPCKASVFNETYEEVKDD
jgi:hypothetical protein